MTLKKPILFFFTHSYPYGTAETFIENELNYISKHFEKVYLFYRIRQEGIRQIPENVEIIQIEPHYKQTKKSILKGNYFFLLYLIFQEMFFSRQKKLFFKKFRYNVSYFINCIYYSNVIKDKIKFAEIENSYFYSYWFFDWNLSLSILRHKKYISRNFTRAHRFDLYENGSKSNYLPLRKFCLKNTDRVISISDEGKAYLSGLYPKFSDKVVSSYLGTKDFGYNPVPNPESIIHIVSCSNIIEVKRVHLIIDIIKLIGKPVHWTHFGDGVLFQSIKQMSKELPEFVSVDFKGRQSQSQIFEFYKRVPVHFFINTSSSEGIPVSIMEAISFGIPVIATNVGGTSEIVNETTGLLIDENFESKKVSDFILQFNNCSDEYYRKAIKTFWKDNFSADINYSKFVQMFHSL